MASSSPIPDPHHYSLARQVIQAIDFLNWAKEDYKSIQNDGKSVNLMCDFASDCYATALRKLSDYLLGNRLEGSEY
jgi:hypothetical protein